MYANTLLNSAIPVFCIKSQEHKIMSTKYFHIVNNRQKFKKSVMGASRDFTRIRIPRVLLGIYRKQALQLNKGNFDEKNLYYIYILSPSLSDTYHCIFKNI